MIYICGDSFCTSDKDYPEIQPWHEQLDNVANLAQVCASNFIIYQQVEQAISSQADYIIVLFTSSLRSELVHNGKLVPFSWLSLNNTTPFAKSQLSILQDYYTLVDVDTEIKKNKLIIEATLQLLVDSQIPFKFDQGGFEHPSYSGAGKYFTKFENYRSKYCLWDYAETRSHRPYFHITNNSIHKQIAEYYYNEIKT
jgi:hypothetical protein